MTPEKNKIFGAFSECPLAPLEVVPTYKYMKNIKVYMNLCSSAVDYTLGCGTLGYLVLTAQPTIFTTHCNTPLITPRYPGICPVMPDPAPTTAIFLISSERTNTKYIYLTSTTQSIVRVRRSSESWSWRNSTGPFWVVSLALRRSQALRS